MTFIPFATGWIRADHIELVGQGTPRNDGTRPVVVRTAAGSYATDPMSPDDATVEIRRLLKALGNAQMPPAPKVAPSPLDKLLDLPNDQPPRR